VGKIKKQSKEQIAKRKLKILQRSLERSKTPLVAEAHLIPDIDNPNQNVMVAHLPHSPRLNAQIKGAREAAAIRFSRDYEAREASLSSMPFDPRVDSSLTVANGSRAAEAEARLKLLRNKIGERNFEVCEAVVIYNTKAEHIRLLGGREHRVVSHDIEVALNELVGFYDPDKMKKDRTWLAFKKVKERGDAEIRRMEHDLNWPTNNKKPPKAKRSVR
jgi:hypothetical protein